MTQNPLLDYSGMPEFSAIKPEHVKEAVTIAINKCRQVIEEVSSKYKMLAKLSCPFILSI